MNNKRTILTIAPIMALLLMIMTTTQSARASSDNAIDRALANGETVSFDSHKDGTTIWSTKQGSSFNGPIVPTFHYNDGTVETRCIKNCDQLSTSTSNSASAAKSDSASSAKSDNSVRCFAFCMGVSNANSGSAANSDSRTNSPGNTATVDPVAPSTTISPTITTHKDGVIGNGDFIQSSEGNSAVAPNVDTSSKHSHHNNHGPTNDILADNGISHQYVNSLPNPNPATPGTACIDNSGSIEDEGYQYGYYDAQGHNGGKYTHGNHTDKWREGYDRGYADGNSDEAQGIYRTPC
jgi:hypothetical protein